MAIQDTQAMVDEQIITNALLTTNTGILNDITKDKSDDTAKSVLVNASEAIPVYTADGNIITTTGGLEASGFIKGYDFDGNIWYVRSNINRSGDDSGVFDRSTWITAGSNVKIEFVREDFQYVLNTPPPNGFVLGEIPHGSSINEPFSFNAASIPTSAPSDTSTNSLASLDNRKRLHTLNIFSTITVASRIEYRTGKNTSIQTIYLPIGTYNPDPYELSIGDFFTEIYVYSSATLNTGNITLNISGFQWNNTPTLTILNITAYLQGADRGADTMGQELQTASLLPTTDPYGTLVTCPTINSLPNIVDWVQLELRDSTDISTIVATKSALITKNGEIVDISGSGGVSFPYIGSFYIAIKHRNHLGLASTLAQILSGVTVNYDFTTGMDKGYAVGGYDPMALLTSGKYAMIGGDANGDAQVYYTGGGDDNAAIVSKVNASPTGNKSGYLIEDINMDGIVSMAGSNNDLDFLLNTVLAGDEQGYIAQNFN